MKFVVFLICILCSQLSAQYSVWTQNGSVISPFDILSESTETLVDIYVPHECVLHVDSIRYYYEVEYQPESFSFGLSFVDDTGTIEFFTPEIPEDAVSGRVAIYYSIYCPGGNTSGLTSRDLY